MAARRCSLGLYRHDSTSIKSLSQNNSLQVLQFAGSNLNLLTFNTSTPPLSDVRVRQAICYAVDRETMIRELLLGQGKIAHSILAFKGVGNDSPQDF